MVTPREECLQLLNTIDYCKTPKHFDQRYDEAHQP